MQTPWFFELLALGLDADERAVKRAYAVRLKQVDPGADPAGFARLREAYEHARAWIAHQASQVAPGDAPLALEPDVAPVDAPSLPLPATVGAPRYEAADPPTVAARLVERFARRVKYGAEGNIAAELAACATALRREHIDVPFLFERQLVEALAHAGIRRRPAVFAAAYAHFGWHEYMHLSSLGPAGGWIDTVEQQRQRFETLDPVDKADIRAWLSAHGDGNGPIPGNAALAWPRIRNALARFPQYLALYLTDERANAWQQQFDAASGEHNGAGYDEARRMVRERAARRGPRNTIDWRLWVAFCAFALWSMHNVFAPSQPGANAPQAQAVRHIPGRTEQERSRAFECMRLVDQIEAPGTLPTAEQAAQARACHAFLDRLRHDAAELP